VSRSRSRTRVSAPSRSMVIRVGAVPIAPVARDAQRPARRIPPHITITRPEDSALYYTDEVAPVYQRSAQQPRRAPAAVLRKTPVEYGK
jgi:hypothetical protein